MEPLEFAALERLARSRGASVADLIRDAARAQYLDVATTWTPVDLEQHLTGQATAGAVPVEVQLVMSEETLLAGGDEPGDLAGGVAGKEPAREEPRTAEVRVVVAAVLRGQLAELKVACVEPGADVALDGATLFLAPGEAALWLTPGTHQLVARKPG